jgi:hypothetical protein
MTGFGNTRIEIGRFSTTDKIYFLAVFYTISRSRWPRGLTQGLRPFAYRYCGFESRQRHGRLSLVSVVCCQVEVPAIGRSLVQRSSTECGVSECDREASTMRKPWPTRGCHATEKIHVVI